jgi:hypothetical protein
VERAETRSLPYWYIPRDYLSAQQAIAELVEARHADLVAGAPDRGREKRRLNALKRASKPQPIIPTRDHTRDDSQDGRPTFTPEQEQRLQQLEAIEQEMRSLRATAANDIRSALAEGDFPATLLTNNGQGTVISALRWRDRDGLTGVRTGRVGFGFAIGTIYGQVLIKRIDFITWMSVNAPKKFSHFGVSIIVPSQTPHADISGPSRSRSHSTDLRPLWPAPGGELLVGEQSQNPIVDTSAGDQTGSVSPPSVSAEDHRSGRQPSVAPATLVRWYAERRDAWPSNRKLPSQDEDLADAKECFPGHNVTREAIRTVRARHAPVSWKAHGRRKLAPK